MGEITCTRATSARRNALIQCGVACCCAALSWSAQAGRLPEEWDGLPQIDSISFSPSTIGLSTPNGSFFVVDRSTGEIQAVSERQFFEKYANAMGPKASVVKNDVGVGSLVVLKTSSGKNFETQNAYCSEGQNMKHGLSFNGVSVTSNVDPCVSISAAEIVDGQLWLGTRWDAEYGDFPAMGVVVQSLDTGRLLKRLDARQGLTGNLVRVIRYDPFKKSVRVATERGISEVNRDFTIASSLFFHEAIDSKTGAIRISLTPSWRKPDPFVFVARQLNVSDAKKLADAIAPIPTTVRERFVSELNAGAYSPYNARTPEQSFAPKETKVLTPFFIEAAVSAQQHTRFFALSGICAFNDKRAIEFLRTQKLRLVAAQNSYDATLVNQCLGKYAKFGLIGARSNSGRNISSTAH